MTRTEKNFLSVHNIEVHRRNPRGRSRRAITVSQLDLRLRARMQIIIGALRADRSCPASREQVLAPFLKALEVDIKESEMIARRLEQVIMLPDGCWSGKDSVENLRLVAYSLSHWNKNRFATAVGASWLWQCLSVSVPPPRFLAVSLSLCLYACLRR